MATLTRRELQKWMQRLTYRMLAEAPTALPEDATKAFSEEIKAIQQQVDVKDWDWLFDQVRHVAEAFGAIEPPSDPPTTSPPSA